ncbi:putative late blight resistance protein homolog R1A-10 isoform X2 [Olea europaea var. sylvestris]|uniref:putative late blight resistance protein homolog R1A-10 isoform X2 n=1 Tax=Olea europaea var. sylvestris TaxID=158386 RepID=UPI000C1D0AA7|nr:putative late blight resistance protein homolog R1A-10 isoform X2 [Olea europaea var. sylvestris]
MDVLHTDLFTAPIDLLQIVIEHISSVSSPDGHRIDLLRLLQSLRDSRDYENIEGIRNFFREFVSLQQELKVSFTVPNRQILSNLTPTPNSNEVVAAFINFLLLMVQVILHFKEDWIARVKGSFQNLRTELGFLISFLGDTTMHLQPTKTLLIDVEEVVNGVGSFLSSFFLTIVVFILINKVKKAHTRMPDLGVVVNEVRSLILEDIPLLTTKLKATIDIKDLLREIGSLLDFFIFTKNDQVVETGILDLALSDLLANFETLKTKIKEHCIAVSKMPSDMAPKTGVVSLFIVDSVLDDLMDLINNKSDSIVVVNDQIVTLHEELMLLGSSITDIALQHEAEHEELVIRSRDIAYEIEYVINSLPHVWYLSLRLPQLIVKIRLIMIAVKETKNNVDVVRMSIVSKHPHELVESESKEPPILEDVVVGFDNVQTEIVEQLVRGTDKRQIISIFGMPGLGKTTLATKLYNHHHVLYRFHNRAWCTVSQIYNKKNVLIEILSSMSNSKGDTYMEEEEESLVEDLYKNLKGRRYPFSNSKRDTYMEKKEENLVEDLYKNLKGRRYLIVVDDIWDIDVWNDLKRCFPDDSIGSRILFTTRIKEVGSKASPCSVKELPFLSEVECWGILQKRVFQDENCPQKLLDIGKQIAKNCHGLPLAVVVIAGILANMEKKKQLWENVARNLSSYISEISEKCIQILQLSYNHLPLHLKPCFLHFGAFREDMEIPVRRLISFWVAEGFIKKEEHKNIEDVAREYLMELIDRGLVLVAERRYDGGVKTCKIHDLLREMCLKIAEENNFLKFIEHYDDDEQWFFSQVSTYQQHHCLSISSGKFADSPLPFGLHVRSLLCESFITKFTKLISCGYKVLRVFRGNIQYGLEHLVQLRYLEVSPKLPPLERYPFHKLEFLVVNNDDEVEIPEILLNMVSLRHMQFWGGAHFSKSSRQPASNSKSFQINNLQSISGLRILDEIDEKILRCSPNLRRLDSWIGNGSFDFLNQLESLKLDKVFHFSPSLISLPLSLKKLRLSFVEASRKQMEIIGRLPYLEVLKLEHVDFGGEQWNTSEDEFPQLKYLKLVDVKIAEWNASSENFPRLERVVLEYCRNLKTIPSSLGDILTLQKIEVYECAQTNIESAKKIQEEQKEMGNLFDVIISGTFGDTFSQGICSAADDLKRGRNSEARVRATGTSRR